MTKNKKEQEEQEEETIEPVEEEEVPVIAEDQWVPKTLLGKKVFSGEIKSIDQILDSGQVVMEKNIVEILVPDLETELLNIGQAKGKFGGGKRRVFRQTQKKTREGNKPRFATLAVVGNRKGIVGLGYGKAKETVPAREKAIRNAKLNVFMIRRGSWRGIYPRPHTIPFKVEGKCGSVRLTLIPAPKGTGLKVDKEVAKILEFAGIEDVWSKLLGKSRTKINLIKATEKALKQLMKTKLNQEHYKRLIITEGSQEKPDQEFPEELMTEPKKK